MKFDYRSLKPEMRRELLDKLAGVFITFNEKDEVKFFLQRLLTESEIVMLVRRLEVAEMLVGGLTYEQIRRKLKVSMSTIRSVDGWLTDAAYEYHLIRDVHRQEARARESKNTHKRNVSLVDELPDELPDELRRIVRGDSRLVLFRLLLGDL